MVIYNTPQGVLAFTTGRDEKPTNGPEDAIIVPATGQYRNPDCPYLPERPLALPRQTHTSNVVYADKPWREPDTDAVWTDCKGLCLAVKTADCIPVLLWDDAASRRIAAIHAGWKGTVQYIVRNTIESMGSDPTALHAVIGPGISLESFEVGDEVYDRFREAAFPMNRIARRLDKWHIDLWEANRWILEQCGVPPENIHIDGTDTMVSPDFYSARRETINTGRNYNCIMLT